MKSYNILFSNFDFDDSENLLKFQFRMLNSSLLVISFIVLLIGTLSQVGINNLGVLQTWVNFSHSLITLILFILLRRSKELYKIIVIAFVFVCLFNISSALVLVTEDEFRMIWYFPLLYLSYMLGGTTLGLFMTLISFSVIVISNSVFDLNLSDLAIHTSLFALIVTSALMRAHSKKVAEFEQSIIKQNEQLKLFSSVDPLTGIMNRRVFSEMSLKYFEDSQRYDYQLVLLSLDIDTLKDINVNYGHPVGDIMIVRFTEVIQSLLRKSDIFARMQGEEFAILLHKTDLEGAKLLAQKIHTKVNAIIVAQDHDFIQITTSIGISQTLKTDSSIKTCLDRSLQALTQAKKDGKDRICLVQ